MSPLDYISVVLNSPALFTIILRRHWSVNTFPLLQIFFRESRHQDFPIGVTSSVINHIDFAVLGFHAIGTRHAIPLIEEQVLSC